MNPNGASSILRGLEQAGVVSALALGVGFYAQRRGIHLMKDLPVSLARGIAQISAVGLMLVVVLKAWVTDTNDT